MNISRHGILTSAQVTARCCVSVVAELSASSHFGRFNAGLQSLPQGSSCAPPTALTVIRHARVGRRFQSKLLPSDGRRAWYRTGAPWFERDASAFSNRPRCLVCRRVRLRAAHTPRASLPRGEPGRRHAADWSPRARQSSYAHRDDGHAGTQRIARRRMGVVGLRIEEHIR
jgi:hypothetical protein